VIPPIHLQPVTVDSPNHDAKRATTAGVVIHSTRGGQVPGEELAATIAWFLRPSSNASSHIVIGRTGALWGFVPAALVAWHARELNQSYLGIEFEQGLPGDQFTHEQYIIGAYVVRDWSRAFGFPINRQTIVGHDETAPGRRDGKSDPGRMFDWDRFLALCQDVRLALDERFRPAATLEYGDLLDVANNLAGIAEHRHHLLDRVRDAAEQALAEA
jgi:N-acetyl-anhydromuramyl-L-alanine amidase AmpD